MEYTLKNKKLTVVFESKGATLHSIKDNDGVEYLWEGNPEYWSGQAPVLFPICGSIRDDKAQIGNRKHICNRVMGKDVPFMEITGPTIHVPLK